MKYTLWLTALIALLILCILGTTAADNAEKVDETTAPVTTEAPESTCTHSYQDATVVTAATCTKDGSQVSVCSICQDSMTEAIPATGHSYQSTTTLATMTEDGEVKSVCKNCGDVRVQILTAMEQDAVIAGTLTEHVVAKEDGFVYLDASSPLIALGGIVDPSLNNGEYYRFVASNKSAYPGDIRREGATAAGGTLRFRITGGSFRIKAIRRTDFGFVNKYGTYSFDIYVGSGIDRTLYTTLKCPFNQDFESETITLPEGVQEVMICLPYNMGFTSLQIAVEEGAYIAAPPARTGGIIGFYGSSITQGYDAPSPSLSHAMRLCLAMDADCMNFGLSGSARGEKTVIDDICRKITGAGLTAFVLDYDWNINSYGELRFGNAYAYGYQTIYEKLRAAIGANIPIVMVSRPYFGTGTGGVLPTTIRLCIGVIKGTCEAAKEAGDYAVAFISGRDDFFGEDGALCHADRVHPNNRGHKMMAAKITAVLEQLLAAS